MSRLNIQDDFDEPWDDFTPTQLERVESHAAVNKGDLVGNILYIFVTLLT